MVQCPQPVSVSGPESSDWLSVRDNSRTELTNYLYEFGNHQHVDAQPGA